MSSSDPVVARRPVFKKAKEVILARNKDVLELIDFKVLNFLMHRAIPSLQARSIHTMLVQDVLRYLGHTSTTRLNETLSRLGKANIEVSYKDEAGSEHKVIIHYLSYDLTMTQAGILKFAFDPLLVELLSDPDVYGTLNISVAQRFKSVYSMRLYEILSLFVKRHTPVWEVGVDELREQLSVENSYAKRMDNFKTRVIDVAVAEINGVSDFRVETDFIRAGRGGSIVSVRFTTSLKMIGELAAPRDVSNPIGKARSYRDGQTIDLMDGRTDSERGVISPLRLETLTMARGFMVETDDVGVLEESWRHDMQDRRVIDADQSFLQWLAVRREKSSNETLGVVDPDTLASLMENF